MRKLIITFVIAGCIAQLPAANHYIRAGASGADDGSDWDDAWDSLGDIVWTRGDTYYIADGSYGSFTMDGSESGTATITFLKATESAHGSATGWQTAYGDGQADFSQVNMNTSYQTFSGVTRNESDWTDTAAYGFKVAVTDCGGSDTTLLAMSSGGIDTNNRVAYVFFSNCGAIRGRTGITTGSSSRGLKDSTIDHNYFTGSNVALNLVSDPNLGGPGVANHDNTVEYNWMNDNWDTSAIHGESIVAKGGSKDQTIRYNVFRNCDGTACLGCLASSGVQPSCTGWKYYGNVFINTLGGNGQLTCTGGGSDGCRLENFEVYNNTIIDSTKGDFLKACQGGMCGQEVGNIVKNNLFYRSTNTISGSLVDHDSNACYPDGSGVSCGTISGETNGVVVSSGNPLVNITTDFHLTAETAAGQALSAPFNLDPDGITRGVDGIWTRGAFERIASNPPPPQLIPTGLRTTLTLSE